MSKAQRTPLPRSAGLPGLHGAAFAPQALSPREMLLTTALEEAKTALRLHEESHPFSRAQTFEATKQAVKQGFSDGYDAGFDAGFRQAGMNVLKTAYAGICLGLHEAFGFGSERCFRALEATQKATILALHAQELVEEVYRVTGLQIDFDEPLEQLWRTDAGAGKWPDLEAVAAKIAAGLEAKPAEAVPVPASGAETPPPPAETPA